MKKKILCAVFAAFMLAAAGCGTASGSVEQGSNSLQSESSSKSGEELESVEVKKGYKAYEVSASNGKKTTGFGAQFDTLIVEPQNSLSDEDWVKYQVNVIKETNLQCVRVRFFPECYERGNDNDDPDVFDYSSPNVDFESAEMKQYYKLFDAFEENDVAVDLSWYGCRTTFKSQDGKINGSWLGGVYGQDGVNAWSVMPRLGANPEDEFAESVSACLKYLFEVKKYTCIKEFSIFPEPDGMTTEEGQFARIASKVLKRLEKDGIRDKIVFSGPADYGNNPSRFDEMYLSKTKFDKATSSVYKWDIEGYNEDMLEFAKGYSAVTDKYGIPWSIAESGTKNFIDPVHNKDSETYDRALYMARFMINMMNGGCTGIKYFVFSDCYYDGALNKLGLFCFSHENWAAKPVFYSWSLIMKYTERESEIFPVETEGDDVNMVAFKMPDGSWSYMMANNGEENVKIAVVNKRADRPGDMNVYKLTEARMPENRELKTIAKSETVNAENGVVYVTLPARSFVVISDKK